MVDVAGIALEMSSTSPIAFFSVRLTSVISSSPNEPQRNATAEPTLPLPIIEISFILLH
jgi:hypothetical protein